MFCSKSCTQKSKANIDNKTTFLCTYCGKEVIRYKCKINADKSKRLFCSMKCHNLMRIKYKRDCVICGKTFNASMERNICCSRKCGDKYNQKRDIVFCNQCGNSFEVIPSKKISGEGRFCTISCKNLYFKFRSNYIGNNLRHMSFWRKDIRPKVLSRDKYSCQHCGKLSNLGKKLHVHHILPRWLGGTNELENLITLCNPCHALAEEKQLRDYTGDLTMTRHKRKNFVVV